MLALDSRNRLSRYTELFHGTINEAKVYPREILKEVLRLNAAVVALAHNHPGGDPEPTYVDRALTLQVTEALNLIDVRVLDHVVVGSRTTASIDCGIRRSNR